MKYRYLIMLCCISSLMSCTSDNNSTQEEDAQSLQEQYATLKAYGQTTTCTNAADWLYTPVGTKACGGPTSYLAFHMDIDTTVFFAMVDAYTEAEKDYNEKWGISSDCSITQEPTGIDCENDLPILLYEY
ncbi:hypothetical protein SAMN05216480_111130 [Pustulibacterium marinum]|uniref:Uncharacterized protein n=1 Tax=Pustulibacterium marinum TaxID=1224947 RepID=A0A1I7HXR2_9FLAO|nr:hypothetical protein [Pustulibacterium marinum]SFU65480.1 hypothetical protein SAMN05216480_111130 [Pustulibacterium marinum]